MASIQGVYLALFGRPADPLGLAFFNQATNNGANLTAIGDLAATSEYQSRFSGQSNTQIITTIYRSLFNRDPDLAGLTFFATALANKTLSINNIAIAIFDGAQGSDVTIRDLKVSAANAFTAQIDTVAEINGYAGIPAANSAAAFIATVTTTAPTAEQITAAVATATSQPPVSTTFTLTDKIDNLVGTAGNDVFLGDNTTVNAADSISGGAGQDVLRLFNTTTVANINAIETVEFNNVDANADVSTKVDVKTVAIKDSTLTAARDLTVAAGQTVELTNLRGAFDLDIKSAATVTSQSIKVDGVGTLATPAQVDINGTGVATVNITGSGTNSGFSLGLTGGALKTVNIDGTARVFLANELTGVTTIDASKSTGGARVLISTTNDVKFTGSSAADRVDVGAAGIGAADIIVGGAGTDTLRTGQAISKADGAGISGFEILSVANGITQDVDALIANNPFTGIEVRAGANTINNINADALKNISFVGDTVGNTTLTGKGFQAGGLSDTATINLDNAFATAADGVDVGTVTFANVDVLNLVSKSDGTPTAAEENSITIAAADLNKLVLSGDQSVAVTIGATTTTLTEIDATAATGAVSVTATGAALTEVLVTGSSKADTLVFNNAATKATITGGAGGDAITIEAAAADVVRFTAATDSVVGQTAGANNYNSITGFGAAGSGNKIDIATFAFTGTQAAVLDKTGVLASVNATTLEVSASAAANFFVDVGNVNRGVAIVDLGADQAVYVDVNKDGILNSGDLAFKLVGTAAPIAAGDFIFA